MVATGADETMVEVSCALDPADESHDEQTAEAPARGEPEGAPLTLTTE